MKAQTGNTEQINRFSILFSLSKNLNNTRINTDNDAWEAILIFRIEGDPREYALFKRGMLLYYRQTGTIHKSNLTRTKVKTTSQRLPF